MPDEAIPCEACNDRFQRTTDRAAAGCGESR